MSTKTPREHAIWRLTELIGGMKIAMLTTITDDGRLWTRPITTHGPTFDGDLWFLTRRSSPKADEVQKHRQVSLSYARPGDNTYISLSGTAEVVVDRQKAQELWDPSYQGWFPGGPDDPDLAMIRVRVERAEYWDAPPMTWITEAGFAVMAPEQRDNPHYHAKIVLSGDANAEAP